MNEGHIPPIPPMKPASEAELAKRAHNKTKLFISQVFPDDAQMALVLARVGKREDSQLLETLPSLLPPGDLTPAMVRLLCDTIKEICNQLAWTKASALPEGEVAAYIRKMPCEKAGEAFLHAYKHLFKFKVCGCSFPESSHKV
jgi:hypothetical protein